MILTAHPVPESWHLSLGLSKVNWEPRCSSITHLCPGPSTLDHFKDNVRWWGKEMRLGLIWASVSSFVKFNHKVLKSQNTTSAQVWHPLATAVPGMFFPFFSPFFHFYHLPEYTNDDLRGIVSMCLLYTSIKDTVNLFWLLSKQRTAIKNVYLCKQNGILYWSAN